MAQEDEGLGIPTIMDKALAARWGPRYVRATAFAIDVDRIERWVQVATQMATQRATQRVTQEAQAVTTEIWPFGWEIFVTEKILSKIFDVTEQLDVELLETVVYAIHERVEAHGDVLGAQWLFAVFDLVSRSIWPPAMLGPISGWKTQSQLILSLDVLWSESLKSMVGLSERCLRINAIRIAPTTRSLLEASLASS